jgi:hypothetical protein
MKMSGIPGQDVTFTCPACGQHWHIRGQDDVSYGPSATIWPSKMKEGSRMYRKEYLPWWLKQRKREATMMYVAGFWSEAEAAECQQRAQEAFDRWYAEHPWPASEWPVVKPGQVFAWHTFALVLWVGLLVGWMLIAFSRNMEAKCIPALSWQDVVGGITFFACILAGTALLGIRAGIEHERRVSAGRR